MSAILFGVFFVLLALSFPVAHALLVGATLGVLSSDHLSLFGIIQQLFLPTQSFPLIAIPFFIMAAELMMTGRLGQHLIDFATDLVGRFRGGHAQVSVLGSTLFGGVSGSAVADATALGKLLDSLADQSWLSAGFLRSHHCRRVHNRHSHSPVDPSHTLFVGLERIDRSPVFRRYCPWAAAGGGLHCRLQYQRAA